MGKIVSMAEWRKRTRDELAAEIVYHDKHPIPDPETDRLYDTLNELTTKTPMADEEMVVVFWTKLVEHLAAIDDDARRQLYVERISALLNQDVVEATREAFAQF